MGEGKSVKQLKEREKYEGKERGVNKDTHFYLHSFFLS